MPKNFEFNRGGEPERWNDRSPAERAEQLLDKYPELGWMVSGDVHATPESSVSASGATVGEALFPSVDRSQLIEFNRAYMAVATQHWVHDGDYESLTACQPDAVKLRHETFDWLHGHDAEVLPDDGSFNDMEASEAINDLGKIEDFVDEVRAIPGVPDTVDHDKLMVHGLRRKPGLSPSYEKMTPAGQKTFLDGMGADFNLGQMLQSESVAANLEGLKNLDKKARDFLLLHTLYDLGGAAGQFVQNGSATLTDATVRKYRYAQEALEGIEVGKTVEEACHDFDAKVAEELQLPLETPEDIAITRLATKFRMDTPQDAARLKAVFDNLPKNTRAILVKEANKAGTDDGLATRIYYSPALLANLLKKAGDDPERQVENMALGMTTLARVYQYGRTRKVAEEHEGGGVQTILISDLAAAAAQDPELLRMSNFNLEGNGLDVTATIEPVIPIDVDIFPRIQNLGELKGDRFAVVGMGGGSDGIQAAVVGLLLEDAGKEVPAVVSVRTAKPQSQGVDGMVPERRTLQNHGGEIYDGVFRITPETTGSGRFLEHLPAGEVPMYQVEDDEETPITDQLRALFNHVGGVDTVIGVDTGGDRLYGSASGLEAALSTPDQDMRSTNAIRGLGKGVHRYLDEIAVGIDSPPNASEILQAENADYFEPNARQTNIILSAYERWKMDGSDDRYFGKTPLAWQKALQSENPDGVMELDLPTRVVTSDKNQWITHTVGQRAMRGMFFTELDDTDEK